MFYERASQNVKKQKSQISQYRRVKSSKNADLLPQQVIELPQRYDATDKRGKTREKSINQEPSTPPLTTGCVEVMKMRYWIFSCKVRRRKQVTFPWKTIIKTPVGWHFIWNKLAYSSKKKSPCLEELSSLLGHDELRNPIQTNTTLSVIKYAPMWRNWCYIYLEGNTCVTHHKQWSKNRKEHLHFSTAWPLLCLCIEFYVLKLWFCRKMLKADIWLEE